jgi:N-acetylglucosamine-6-phosphate deacetylase
MDVQDNQRLHPEDHPSHGLGLKNLRELSGDILTADGWISGRLVFDGAVLGIHRDPASTDDDEARLRIVPGLIDLHVHGGGGGDSMNGEADVRRLARFHARHGTTSLLPTTMTAARDDLLTAVAAISRVYRAQEASESRLLGLHLEGPFINPDRLGAQPPLTCPPDRDLFDRLNTLLPILVITLAPEMDPDGIFLRHVAGLGARVQIGHSDASYEEAVAALHLGATGFTHLFNAMSPMLQRAPGVVGAALAEGQWAEIILDGHHVAPGAVRAAMRSIPNLYGVTDATSAAGMADGPYRLGRHEVVKAGGTVRLADGTLAGSALTMDQALRNLIGFGLPLDEAVYRLSTLPARYLGLQDRGHLTEGARADILVLDRDHTVRQVFVGGTEIELSVPL